MTPPSIKIANRLVGPGHPCFIIAEAGVNHNGSFDLALQLIDVAVEAETDAVKFQTANPQSMVSRYAPKAKYQFETTDSDETHLEMLERLHPFSPNDFKRLMDYCSEQGIIFLSSPFDQESIDLLDSLEVGAFKVPSGEITNLPYLTRMAGKGRPMIISTGMAYLSEVETAVRTVQEAGNDMIALLHCVSNYPADPADANLRAMFTMEKAFHVPVGFSDHTLGVEVPLAAVALGAPIIEKHFTLDHDLAGPDHNASLEPGELTKMVQGIRVVEAALGQGRKEPVPSELDTALVARKSLIAARDLTAGTALTEDMIATKRPGTGLAPAMRPYLVGRSLRVDVAEDTVIDLDMLL